MAELTEVEIQDLRKDIGDGGAKPRLAHRELQRAYTLAEGDHDTTRVIALRWLLAKCVPKTPEFEQTERLLELWMKQAGMDGGKISIGALDLGIDQEDVGEWG